MNTSKMNQMSVMSRVNEGGGKHMKMLDPLAFLFGSRAAISRLATSRATLYLGFLLVLTAGVSRHYDQINLTEDFRWLYGPHAVSLISSLLVFLAVFAGLRLGVTKVGFWTQYLGFLGLFWMTAPVAWLYAIPVEHWLDPIAAAKWNLLFLGMVSAWRVLLISRVVSVTANSRFGLALLFVLIPASLEMAAATFLIRLNYNIVSTMSGADVRPDVQLMVHAADLVRTVSLIVLGSALALVVTRRIYTRRGHPGRSDPAPQAAAGH